MPSLFISYLFSIKIKNKSSKSYLSFWLCLSLPLFSSHLRENSKLVRSNHPKKFLLFPFRDWNWHCLLAFFCHHLFNNPYWFCMVFQPRFLNRQISWHCSKSRKCMEQRSCFERKEQYGLGLPKMEMMLETPPPIGPQKKQSNFLQLLCCLARRPNLKLNHSGSLLNFL